MPLGNSEAVRKAQGRERQPAKTPSPAKETATATRAKTPERETPEEKPVDAFAERLRRAVPGISDVAIEELRKTHGPK